MRHYYYTNLETDNEIKNKYISAVEKFYGDKVDPDFLKHINNKNNLRVNVEIKDYLKVKLDVAVSIECSIDHKVYEVEGYEIKEKYGSLSIDEKRNYYTDHYKVPVFERFNGIYKAYGDDSKSTLIENCSESTKIDFYKDYTPISVIAPFMKDSLVSSRSLAPEINSMKKSHQASISKNATVTDATLERAEIRNLYEDTAETYAYPIYYISFSFSGKSYKISYGVAGEALEKRGAGGKNMPTFKVLFSQAYKDNAKNEANKTFKKVRRGSVYLFASVPIIVLNVLVWIVADQESNKIAKIPDWVIYIFIGAIIATIATIVYIVIGFREYFIAKKERKLIEKTVERDEEADYSTLNDASIRIRIAPVICLVSLAISVALYLIVLFWK